MSPLSQVVQNPQNCSKFQNINTAFCISHMLFNKNNTCSHEPLEQTCYLQREMNHAMEKTEGCYEGFYARCHVNDYSKHIKDNDCVMVEALLLEWCTCEKSKNESKNDKVEKDCTCFPHHTRPYTVHNFKAKDNKEDKENSCICSNIHRKKCYFPKDRKVWNEPINCTTVNNILPLESNMNCSTPEYQKRVENFKKQQYNHANHPVWSQLVQRKKEFIVRRKNESQQATEATLSNTGMSSGTTSQNSSLETQGNSGEKQILETVLQFPDQLKFGIEIGQNTTISQEEKNLEGSVDELLTGVLGKANFTGHESLDYNSHLTNPLPGQSLSLTKEKEEIQRTNMISGSEYNSNASSVFPITTQNFEDSRNNSENALKDRSKLFKYAIAERNKMLEQSGNTTIQASIIGAFIFGVLCYIIYKQIKKSPKYSKLKETRVENGDNTETTDSPLEENNTTQTEDIPNISKRTFNPYVLYFNKSKEDNKCLIKNEKLEE